MYDRAHRRHHLGERVKQLKWVWFDHRTDLPQWITMRIGRIMVEWSVLERELEEIIQMLTNTDIGIARIVTNRMNSRMRISVIRHLIEWYVYHGRLKGSILKEFIKIGKRIEATQNRRDMVAHGLWTVFERKWWVLKLRGQRATPELKPELDKLSREFLPQKELITRGKLNTIVQEIISGAEASKVFCEDVYRVLPKRTFQYEPPKYTRRRRTAKHNATVTAH